MLAIILILLAVLPPAVWLLAYFNLDPGEGTVEDACAAFEFALVKSWEFWTWAGYVFIMVTIFSGGAETFIRWLDTSIT